MEHKILACIQKGKNNNCRLRTILSEGILQMVVKTVITDKIKRKISEGPFL